MAWIAPGRSAWRWDEPPYRYGGLDIEMSVWIRVRRSGLREDGLKMLTARRHIALQSAGPLLQLDFPLSDVAPLAGVADLGGAEQISDAGVVLSFELQGWAAFEETRRPHEHAPGGGPAPAGEGRQLLV